MIISLLYESIASGGVVEGGGRFRIQTQGRLTQKVREASEPGAARG